VSPEREAAAGQTAELSLRSAWDQYWRVPVVGLLAALLAFAGSWLVSPSYDASTHLLVRGRSTTFLSAKGTDLAQTPGVIDSDLAKALGDTQSALVSTPAIAREVVDALHLDRPRPGIPGPIAALRTVASSTYKHVKAFIYYGGYRSASRYDTAVAVVQQHLSATPVNGSYVLEITATADNPKLAALIADAAADALVRTGNARYARDSSRYRDLLKQQVDAAAQAQVATTVAVSRYKAEHGISDLNTQLSLTATAAADLTKQLRDVGAQLQGARAQLDSINASVARTQQSAQNNQTITTGRSSTSIDSSAPSQIYQSLVGQRDQVAAQAAGLDAQRAALQTTLDTNGAASGPLSDDEAGLKQLQLQEQVASTNFSQLSASYNTALLSTPENTVELSAVDKAELPIYPSGPLRYLYLAVGLVLGLVVGFVVSQWKVLRLRRRGPDPLSPEQPDTVADDTSLIDLVSAQHAAAGNGRLPTQRELAAPEPRAVAAEDRE